MWIPTLFHKHLTSFIENNILCDDPEDDINQDNAEISDGKGKSFCYLDLTLKRAVDETKPEIRDIWIYVRGVERKWEDELPQERTFWSGNRETDNPDYCENVKRSLKLECLDVSRNGLIQYRYELPEGFTPENQTHPLIDKEEKITHAVYHAIKEFFHEHKFHKTSKDSIINPYANGDEINIKSTDNPALLHYLKQFEDRLFIAIEEIDVRAHRITSLRSIEEGEGLEEALIETQSLLDECTKALGFGVYYKSLYSSKYNLSFKKRCKSNTTKDTLKEEKEQETTCDTENVNPVENEECTCEQKNPECKKDREYYQCAINIETSLNYIKVIRNQHRDFFNTVSTFINIANQDKIVQSQDEFSELQQKMSDSVSEIEGIQNEASAQLKSLETAMGRAENILVESKETSKKWNKLNLRMATGSIVLGLVGAISLYVSFKSPSKEDITEILKENIIKQTDSIIDARNENLLKSIKDLQPQPETENQKPG